MNDKIYTILESSASLGFSGLIKVLIGAVLFLIVGVVLVIILGRKKVFKRSSTVWNVLTGIYYAYIPIVFAIFGGILGGIYGANRAVTSTIEKQGQAFVEAVMPEIPEFLEYLGKNQDSLAGYSTGDLIDKYFEEEGEKDESTYAKLVNKGGKWVLEGTLDALVNYSADKIGVEEETAELTVDAIMELDLEKLDESVSKIVVQGINHQANGFFKTLYISVLIKILIFLAIPIIETIAYFAAFRKKAEDEKPVA